MVDMGVLPWHHGSPLLLGVHSSDSSVLQYMAYQVKVRICCAAKLGSRDIIRSHEMSSWYGSVIQYSN